MILDSRHRNAEPMLDFAITQLVETVHHEYGTRPFRQSFQRMVERSSQVVGLEFGLLMSRNACIRGFRKRQRHDPASRPAQAVEDEVPRDAAKEALRVLEIQNLRTCSGSDEHVLRHVTRHLRVDLALEIPQKSVAFASEKQLECTSCRAGGDRPRNAGILIR